MLQKYKTGTRENLNVLITVFIINKNIFLTNNILKTINKVNAY